MAEAAPATTSGGAGWPPAGGVPDEAPAAASSLARATAIGVAWAASGTSASGRGSARHSAAETKAMPGVGVAVFSWLRAGAGASRRAEIATRQLAAQELSGHGGLSA